MRISEIAARARGRIKAQIAAPQRREAVELVGVAVLVVVAVLLVAVVANQQQKAAP